MAELNPEGQTGAHLDSLAMEITESARIEDQVYSYSAVRSSVARKLGFQLKEDIAGPGRKAEALISVLLDAVQYTGRPLTELRILGWHKVLMEHDAKVLPGAYRNDEMRAISGRFDKEVIHFEAPPPETVAREMARFGDWLSEAAFNENPWVADSLAHLWFATIHPFDDGNGRIARAIGEHFLAQADQSALRFFSYSRELNKSRVDYYAVLESTQKAGLDVTPWMTWSLDMLNRSMESSLRRVGRNRVALELWNHARAAGLNGRQQTMLVKLIDGFEGNLTTTKWAQICKCSQDTAERDLNHLVAGGILRRFPSGGRGMHYAFGDLYALLSDNNLLL